MFSRLKTNEFTWIWLATAALFLASAVIAPGTVRPAAVSAMLPFAAMLAIIAVGQTIVIQQRGIDLSAAALMGLGGMLAAHFSDITGSAGLGILLTLICGALCGVLNGLLIARLNIASIVATLATGSLFAGIMLTMTKGRPLQIPESVELFSHDLTLGIPNTLWMAFLFIAIVAVTFSRTVIGRGFIAVGANPLTARAAGIRVTLYQIGTYVGASICFSVAGILYAGFIGSASHTAGAPYLLPGIAAVIIGGTSFMGGRGSVVASGVAALFMTQLDTLIAALGARAAEQLLVQALVIIIASLIPVAASNLKIFMRG